ncbi:hypothetical protein JAAARDRAFT_200863 [Jaapia argillacea MUCL 33604]|uniref:Uncharacterized protein n=1 Tax=Jaapia argillacea MUCL 33604 TaxID=933084 RepID=A0A067PG60_9AGAM|nr:hypothetical protein JAAARDRAFT_200863 [Jaapia argillacea MUCL 33604]
MVAKKTVCNAWKGIESQGDRVPGVTEFLNLNSLKPVAVKVIPNVSTHCISIAQTYPSVPKFVDLDSHSQSSASVPVTPTPTLLPLTPDTVLETY